MNHCTKQATISPKTVACGPPYSILWPKQLAYDSHEFVMLSCCQRPGTGGGLLRVLPEAKTKRPKKIECSLQDRDMALGKKDVIINIRHLSSSSLRVSLAGTGLDLDDIVLGVHLVRREAVDENVVVRKSDGRGRVVQTKYRKEVYQHQDLELQDCLLRIEPDNASLAPLGRLIRVEGSARLHFPGLWQ